MDSPDAGAGTSRNRRTLWLILAVCAAPLIASYAAYYWWQPSERVNYGELLEPQPMPDVAMARLDGSPFRLSELKGEWVLLAAGTSACEDTCRRNLVYMRQVRLAQGKETGRIERVWLVTDGKAPEPAVIADHPGLVTVRAADAVMRALPADGSPVDHVYVIDPLGNLMMRFPVDPDPRRMLKDLSRLLRHSKWK